MKRMLMLALVLVVTTTTLAAGSGCPRCNSAHPQDATSKGLGEGAGFAVSVEVVASLLWDVISEAHPLLKLLPTLDVERTGAITGSVRVSGCNSCCSDPTPRLAVATTIESEGVAESVLPVELIRSAAHNVNVQVTGPTVLDIRDDVELEAALADSGVATLDENPARWIVKVEQFTIQGQGTKIKLDFWGLISTAFLSWQESNVVQTRSDILPLLGPNDLRITETKIGDVIPRCLCVREDAEAGSVDVDEAALEQTNEAPLYSFKTDIRLSLPGTTVIPNAFSASDSDGDCLHFYLDPFGVPADRYTYTIDPETGTMVLTIGGMSQEAIERAVRLGRSSTLYVFDLKDDADVPANTWPPAGSYHHERGGDLRVTYTVAQPPVAVPKKLVTTVAELRKRGRYVFEAIFGARDLSPDDAGMRLGIRVRKGHELSGFRMISAEVDPRTGSGLTTYPVDSEDSDATHYAKAQFEYVGDQQNPPVLGEYEIEFEVYKQILATGEQWSLDTGTFTLEVVNSPPLAIHDEFTNVTQQGTYARNILMDVLHNDHDVDGDALSPVINEQPAHGAVRLLEDGRLLYIPEEDFVGLDEFSYYATDGIEQSAQPARVIVAVASPVHPSILIESIDSCVCPDQPGEAQENCTQIAIQVIDPELDLPGVVEKVTLNAQFDTGAGRLWLQGFGAASPWQGSALIDSSLFNQGEVVVRLDRTYAEHTIKITAEDMHPKNAGILVSLQTANSIPRVTFDGETWHVIGSSTYSGQCASIGPSRFTMEPAWYEAGCLQFRDLDGDPLTFRMTQFPRCGTANLSVSGSAGNYFVTVMYEIDREEMLACHRDRQELVDQLVVEARDPYGGVSTATMYIRFEVVNSPPVCENDSAVTLSGVPVTIGVLANDSDPDEDTLTIAEVATPAGGGASVVGNEVVYTPDPGVCGTDTFSYVADDGYDGQTTAWISVEVTDTVNPVAVCEPTTLYLDATGSATLDPTDLDGGSTDNCSIAGFTASQKHFACNEVGVVPVMMTVVDGAGNSDSCWTSVTVVDAIDPVAVGQDVTVQLDATGSAMVQATTLDNGSSDNCSIVSYLIDGAASKTFSCAHRGINLVSFTVADASGNTHSANVSITVEDVLPPAALCQSITASLDADGEVTIAAGAVDGGSTDNCGIASLMLDRDTFTEADIGDQIVPLTVTDTSGNADMCTATVSVQDDSPPIIGCPADVFVQADTNRCYATGGIWLGMPTATDNTEVDWTTLTNNAPSHFSVGTTSVIWAVDDIYGNSGQCFQQVTVTEPIDPTLSCPGDITAYTHDEAGMPVAFSASATDNCDPNPQISFSPSSGSMFPVGDTVVMVTATDDSGNTDTCTFTVTVIFQNDPPVANDDTGTVPEGGGCIVISVLSNDSDPDTDSLTITSVGTPQCGTTEIINAATQIRYCTEGCFDPPSEITFNYTVTDGYEGFDTATVTVDMPDGPIIFVVPPPEGE